uniref:ATP synthase complex subunit 8 n=1 Tax=Symphylella sp. YG-2006 TaxID=390856 RepID=B7S765_9MYRI|nr:ATP synthase F0 subunit 8 [Symphylella sp. YG-2006]ABQ01734.1 ATP synthase F0 subunit 8 [Symphylella sp. YG-2006]
MPQMMPIAWMQMFVLINLALLFIMAKSHFMKTTTSESNFKKFSKKMNWKW